MALLSITTSMFAIAKLLLLLVSLFAYRAAAAGGCSQCSGTMSVNFNDFATRSMADQIVAGRLAGCATGKQYVITRVTTNGGCFNGAGVTGCKGYVYSLTVGRYCGIVSRVNKSQSSPPFSLTCATGGRCSVSTSLLMSCRPNIDCIGQCDAGNC